MLAEVMLVNHKRNKTMLQINLDCLPSSIRETLEAGSKLDFTVVTVSSISNKVPQNEDKKQGV